MEQDVCRITTGEDYNLGLVDVVSIEGKVDDMDVQLWSSGTTPVMTLFFNGPGDDEDPALFEPEVHLTCLKTVPSQNQVASSEAFRQWSGTVLSTTGLLSSLVCIFLPMVG